MAEGDVRFAGAVPDIYDRYMVPLTFEGFARDMAARVAAERPMRVLETAAGSGVVSRALAPLLEPGARYVVTDLNPPMLERARARQADARGWNGGWRMRWPCPSPMRSSTWCSASSA